MPAFIKLLTEMGPLLVFLAAYFYGDMILATKAIMISAAVALAITCYYEKKLPIVALCTTSFILILGAITIFTGNVTFMKIKPTILYIIFASIIFGGLAVNKPILKHIFAKGISLTDHAWMLFSKRWGYFFIFLAILNEIVWRNFSESIWVKFKVFGITPIIIIFLISQLPFLSKNKIETKSS